MKSYRVQVSHNIPTPADKIYSIIRDYEEGHPPIIRRVYTKEVKNLAK